MKEIEKCIHTVTKRSVKERMNIIHCSTPYTESTPLYIMTSLW